MKLSNHIAAYLLVSILWMKDFQNLFTHFQNELTWASPHINYARENINCN